MPLRGEGQGEGNPVRREKDQKGQVHATRKQSLKVYGSGLGLSLAGKTVQLPGGELHINMLASGGTEAVVLVPGNSRV